MIKELSKDEIQKLSIESLASRMDSLLEINQLERYGPDQHKFYMGFQDRPTVKKLLNTKYVQQMPSENQRSICHLTFNTMLQMEYSSVASAATNCMVYRPNFNEQESWKSVKVQINNAALDQFSIISSRIAMECFMELLHFLGEGKRIRAKKSTFNSFKKWLNNPQNPFSYFATHILRSFVFDRNFRTPEVHAASKLNARVLRMKTPTRKEKNSSLQLTNAMLNTWPPLIQILNGEKASSMQGSEEDFRWLNSYLHDDDKEKALFLKSIFEKMQ